MIGSDDTTPAGGTPVTNDPGDPRPGAAKVASSLFNPPYQDRVSVLYKEGRNLLIAIQHKEAVLLAWDAWHDTGKAQLFIGKDPWGQETHLLLDGSVAGIIVSTGRALALHGQDEVALQRWYARTFPPGAAITAEAPPSGMPFMGPRIES